MSERELSEVEAVAYAKQILGRSHDFEHVYKFYSRFAPVRLPNPEPIDFRETREIHPIPILEVEFCKYLVVTGDVEVIIYIGYCEELDTLIYYHKGYFRD